MSGAAIEIDTSQVPLDKLDRPDFVELRAQIEHALANQGWLHAFSIHEAGHLIYLERTGFMDFRYFGPRITYDAEKDEFSGFPASVQPQMMGGISAENFDFDKWFLEIAKGHAAGGVFAQVLTAAPDVGDDGDRENFEAICSYILEKAPGSSIDLDATWKAAQRAVRNDLRSPAFRKIVWEKAGELRERMFGRR